MLRAGQHRLTRKAVTMPPTTATTAVSTRMSHCKELQHIATHCNTIHCNTLTQCNICLQRRLSRRYQHAYHTVTRCNTLEHIKHTATYAFNDGYYGGISNHNTLQYTATHCDTLQHMPQRRLLRQYEHVSHTAIHYNALQCKLLYTATHCNVMQRTATNASADCCYSRYHTGRRDV